MATSETTATPAPRIPCEETTGMVGDDYIRCGRPSVALIYHEKDRRAYWMCEPCADHNTRNRGGMAVHPGTAPSSDTAGDDLAVKSVMVALEPPDRQTFDSEKADLMTFNLPATIETAEQFKAIDQQQAAITQFLKRVKPMFDSVCTNAHRAWQDACALRRTFFDPVERADAKCRTLLSDYNRREEKKRRDEELRQAEERAAEERKRLDREARLLERQGQKEMATAVRNTPVAPQPVTLPSTVEASAGLTFRKQWKWRPIGGDTPANRERAVKLVPREYLELDDKKLTNAATNYKGVLKVPGIEFYEDDVTVRR